MDVYSKAQEKLNISSFNRMQLRTFETIPKGVDTVLLSITGSGKTLAFLLPILAQIEPASNGIQCMIITPTRELALQISAVIQSLAFGINHTCCYGGHPIRIERKALQKLPDIVVGTPGRILDHLEREQMHTNKLRFMVLDEFDKILELGFQEQIAKILGNLRQRPQYILTSATEMKYFPDFIHLRSPTRLDFIKNNDVQGLLIQKIVSPEKDKLHTLVQLLHQIDDSRTFVFVNFRETCLRLQSELAQHGIYSEVFHGGLEQIDRENTLSKFRNGSAKIMISTDLGSRGLDIPNVEYVIHYHLPLDQEIFTHRNGRTARMEGQGHVFIITSIFEEEPTYIAAHPVGILSTNKESKIVSPQWVTIKLNKGRMDKIRKIDVVGFILKQSGIDKDDLGLIEVKEKYALAAINRGKIDLVLKRTDRQKIKGKKVLVSKL